MKILNKTQWETADLKALCTAVIKHEGGNLGRTVVSVEHTRGKWTTYVHGKATLTGRSIWMYVPRIQSMCVGSDGKWAEMPATFPVESFARVFTHELHHNMGLRHEDMVATSRLDSSYVKDMKVRAQLPPAPKQRDRAQERAQKIASYEERVKAFDSRIKRLKTLQKKYQKRLYALKRAGVPTTISSETKEGEKSSPSDSLSQYAGSGSSPSQPEVRTMDTNIKEMKGSEVSELLTSGKYEGQVDFETMDVSYQIRRSE